MFVRCKKRRKDGKEHHYWSIVENRRVKVEVTLHGQGKTQTATLTCRLDRDKLRVARRREGRCLLRTNMTDTDPVHMWEYYLQFTEIEQAFKELKGDLAIRPIHHQHESRIQAHIFILNSISQNQGLQCHQPLQSAKSG